MLPSEAQILVRDGERKEKERGETATINSAVVYEFSMQVSLH